MNRKDKSERVIADVTEDEYRNDLALGLETDEVLLPGRHKFRRGGFLKRHCLVSAQIPTPIKVSISVGTDADMPNGQGQSDASSVLSCAETLLADKHFIEAVAMRVKTLNSEPRKRTGRPKPARA
jgi:hypothetical protein